MEMDLKTLLDKGLEFYYEDLDNLSHEEVKQIEEDIEAIISTEALEKEPALVLVLDFFIKTIYNKRVAAFWEIGDMLGLGLIESEEKYLEVQDFLRYLIYTHHKPVGLSYIKQYKAYYNDKGVLATIKDFGFDPEQFWYLLHFCKYYVNSRTKNLDKSYPSVREDLEMLVNEISKMEFDNIDWRISLPRTKGELSIKVDKKQHKIIHHTTLHLLSTIVQEYLDKKHDYDTDYHLNVHELQISDKLIKYLYCRHNISKLTVEEKEFYNTYNPFNKEDVRETQYDSRSNMRRVALFTYYIEHYLDGRVGHKNYVYEIYTDYDNHSEGINHDKLFLISQLLYIMGSDLHQISKEKRHNLLEKNYLKDCLKGYRIKDQKGVDECWAAINKERLTNS